MARSPDKIPSNRLKDAIPESLQKFLPLMSTSGDGLVVLAWLNKMGLSANTLLDRGRLPNMTSTSLSSRIRQTIGEKDIADMVRDSNLPVEIRSEMLDLLTKKRINDTRSVVEEVAPKRDGETQKKPISDETRGATQAFREHAQAVKHAADMALNRTAEKDIVLVLHERFGLRIYRDMISKAFGSLAGVIKNVYPNMSDEEINRRIGRKR